jgi:hypothetical protein
MVFFPEIHVFLQLSSIGLFGTNGAYLHLEKPKSQDTFLSKTKSILRGKQGVLDSVAPNIEVYFGVAHVFLQLT